MSTVYNLEPPPTAKVILQTTAGDLSLELFAKQTPLASRNFLQHCLDGYYNGTIFHRLLPGFVLQGGDPTGTGAGGESAVNGGAPFEDEFHSRLKFNRRGLLGMANEGKDSNTSQFFLTLGVTPELQGRNTMFGRVEGDTIYNLMKMAEAELTEGGGSDRPLYPTRISGAEILVNPFEDMVARAKIAPRTSGEAKKERKKRKKPPGKQILSFGGDDDDEEAAAPRLKNTKFHPNFVPVHKEEDTEMSERPQTVDEPPAERQRKQHRPSTPVPDDAEDRGRPEKPAPPSRTTKPPTPDSPPTSPEPEREKKPNALDKANAEIAVLKASMKRRTDTVVAEKPQPKNALEVMIPATSTRGRKRGKASDERGALDLFKAFKQRLEGLPPEAAREDANDSQINAEDTLNDEKTANDGEAVDEEAELCDLHFIANCQSCKSWDQEKPDGRAEADGDDNVGWMAHSLAFAKDTLGKDLEWKKKMAELEVIDPREKARNIKDEQRKKRDKGKGRAMS